MTGAGERPKRASAKTSEAPPPRNLVVMLDGTGNELGRNLSNVLKLFRIVRKNEGQLVYYDPGVGTIGEPGRWRRLRQNARKIFGLMTGWGLDDNVLEAYSWLCRTWREGDRIWLFGFSRGAWSARVLGGFIHMIGLLRPEQLNMCSYAMVAYKKASEKNDLSIAWHFARVSSARRVTIHFVGVWDTVASVIVPRWDRLVPSLETLPYTEQNPSVRAFRHALAIDERRRMFKPTRWKPGQKYVENPFSKREKPDQDAAEMWFAGVHSDIGGGYPEGESGLSKFPLVWMTEEAKEHGLLVDTAMFNHLVRGKERKGSKHSYVAPDAKADQHNSLTLPWWILEVLPKAARPGEARRWSVVGLHFPLGERRRIDPDDQIHRSVRLRQAGRPDYQPPNLPRGK
jgi:uncharacterized protein (DUF2235 family)